RSHQRYGEADSCRSASRNSSRFLSPCCPRSEIAAVIASATAMQVAAGHRISFRIDLTEYHLQFRSREMGSRRYCFLSEDAYIDSSVSPRMTYDKLRCMTVSYCGLAQFPVHSQYFILKFFPLLLDLQLLRCDLPPAYHIWHTVEVGWRWIPSNEGPAIGTLM